VGSIVGLLRPSSRRPVLYLVGGLAISFVASGFGFFVYAHRYVWYAFPLSVVLVAGGLLIPTWAQWSLSRILATGSVLILLLGLLAADLPALSGVPFQEREQFGEIVHYVEARRQAGDAIYVYYGAEPAFDVYATRDLASLAVVEKWGRGTPASQQQADMWSVLGGRARGWLLLSHIYEDEDKALLSVLNTRCRQLDAVTAVSAMGYLFDCASSP